MPKTKLYMIRARVSTKMKRQIEQLAHQKGEAEAVLIREALTEYIAKRQPAQPEPEQPEPEQPSKLAVEEKGKEEDRRRRVGFHPTNKRLMGMVKHLTKTLAGSAAHRVVKTAQPTKPA